MTDGNTHIDYSLADIERYLNGGMTAKEMHEMERTALQDPFLADAIEGYRSADLKLADKHLNEIAASLQKQEPAKVILMPKKKQYGWLAAASFIAVIGAGVFLFSNQNKSSEPLAASDAKKDKREIAPAEESNTAMQKKDSQPLFTSPENAATTKGEEKNNRIASLQKKKPSADRQSAETAQPEVAEAPRAAMAASPQQSNSASAPITSSVDKDLQPKASLKQSEDSLNQRMSLSEVIVTRAKTQNKIANPWTTDKGKPFLLSDVEVINLTSKKRNQADTSVVQPEGGWQSFQNYLVSRLSRHDSLLLVNDNYFISNNIELEFSVDKTGLPYDIKVLNAGDSTVTNKIVSAIESGPKWKSGDNNEKRLRIKY